MCLKSVTEIKNLPKKLICYQVKQMSKRGRLYPLFKLSKGEFKKDIWNKANDEYISPYRGVDYPSGFHAYKNYEEAKKYFTECNYSSDFMYCVVAKIELRSIVCKGKQKESKEIYVGKKAKFIEIMDKR